jgi:histidinol dehydrogenase
MIKITNSYEEVLNRINQRNQLDDNSVIDTVTDIMYEVRRNGDKALREYTLKFDSVRVSQFKINEKRIKRAYEEVDDDFLAIIRNSIKNVKEYHKKQLFESWEYKKNKGITLGQKVTPLSRVGVYVPGGNAPLISSVIMNAVPAKVAGVEKLIMCTPPPIDSGRIVAAIESGVDEIYKVGGAQAIFAMAFGTESIEKVDKITGPGNVYVANAKKMAFGFCDIDMIAGPSEIMIIADGDANVSNIAADLLSQAEHDKKAACILATDSYYLAEEVKQEMAKQLKKLKRKDIIKNSISDFGVIYVNENIDSLFDLANDIAPEHLELLLQDADEKISKVKNAGAIFVGEYSPEPLGDYFAGPNHTLPTGGTAKFFSPLGAYDFLKRTSIIKYDKTNLKNVYKKIDRFALEEQLDAHAKAIRIRFEGTKK